jgi:hypothetical protein
MLPLAFRFGAGVKFFHDPKADTDSGVDLDFHRELLA